MPKSLRRDSSSSSRTSSLRRGSSCQTSTPSSTPSSRTQAPTEGLTHLRPGSREQLFFARREVLDIGVIYPVALRLRGRWARSSSIAIASSSASGALESWLVRRMTLRLTAQNYNRVMLEVLTAMSNAGDPVSGLVEHLRSYAEDTPTGWWPTDERFRAHLLEQPLYGSITQARVRMLLEAAEARLHTPKTEKFPPPPSCQSSTSSRRRGRIPGHSRIPRTRLRSTVATRAFTGLAISRRYVEPQPVDEQ